MRKGRIPKEMALKKRIPKERTQKERIPKEKTPKDKTPTEKIPKERMEKERVSQRTKRQRAPHPTAIIPRSQHGGNDGHRRIASMSDSMASSETCAETGCG